MKISTGKLDLFADTMADYNGTIGFDDIRADQAVAYVSPNWAGFQFMGAIIPGGAATALGDQNWNNDGIASGYSLAAIYSNGPFYGSAAYESLSTDMFMSTATALNGCSPVTTFDGAGNPLYTMLSCGQQTSDYNKWRFGLGLLDWNGFSLTAIYENEENLPGSSSVTGMDYYDTLFAGASDYSWRLSGGPDKRELWQVQAGYSFGNWMLKGMYGQASYSGGNTQLPTAGETLANSGYYQSLYNDYFNGNSDSWAIGVDYNFSKRTKAYMLYTSTTIDGGNNASLTDAIGDFSVDPGVGGNTNDNSQWDGFSIGMMHSF
jgi:predicted porin